MKNKLVQLFDLVLGSLLNGIAPNLIYAAIVGFDPIFGFPIIGWIVKYFIGSLTEWFYSKFEPAGAYAIIHFQNKQERDAFRDNWKIYSDLKKKGATPDEIKRAKEKVISNFDDTVHSHGS